MSKSDNKNSNHSNNGHGNGKGHEKKISKGSAKRLTDSLISQRGAPKPTASILNSATVEFPVPPVPAIVAKAKRHASRSDKKLSPVTQGASAVESLPSPAL
ncbi:MAG: hypothetical protein HQM06_05705 [Magnetococcales bacterium]|nr:hypothetical protein [Magnetococcales bacterium]